MISAMVGRVVGRGWVALTLAVAVLVAACGDDPAGPGVDPVTKVEIVPPGGVWTGAFNVGDTVTLAARPLGGGGSPLPPKPVRWASSDTMVAKVDSAGLMRARGAGTARVTATVQGVVGSVTVTVSPAAVDNVVSLIIHPQAAVLDLGQTITYIARGYDAEGVEVVGVGVTWMNDSPGVISVTPNTLTTAAVKAIAAGYGQVTARMGGVTTSVGLTVVAPEPTGPALALSAERLTLPMGTQSAVRAVVLSAQGDTVPGRSFTWSVEGGGAVSVTPTAAQGHAVVTARSTGTATLVARSQALEARIQFTVTAGQAVSHMEMRPPTLLAELGVAVTLGVHAWGPDGSFVADANASWTSSDPTIAQVTGFGPRGVLRGLREGTVEVTASAGSSSVRATVEVRRAGPVGHVIVTPAKGGVWNGSLFRMTARTLTSSGGDLPGQPVAWEVEDTTVATIEADGLMLAKKPGTTRVFARSGGKQGVSEIRVYATPAERMVFDLEPTRGANGEWRPLVSLADTIWTDPEGTVHTASQFLSGGTLEVGMGSGSLWTQTFAVEVVVTMPTGPKVVARKVYTDRGSWGIDVHEPWHLTFISAEFPGYSFEGRMPEAGRFKLDQVLSGTTVRDYLWLMR